ncbi:hypothetical protein ACQP1W_01035 [Spirillospora sp. CA-255316]
MHSTILARFRPVAVVTQRPHRTIRNWAAAGRIERIDHRGTVLVDLVQAAALSERTGRRNRTSAA